MAKLEQGQRAYEAWCGSHGRDPAWRLLHPLDQLAWKAAEQACAVPAATPDPIAMYRDVISAAAAAVRLACGVDEDNEGEAEQLRKAAIKCRDLGKALLEATQAAEAGKAQPVPAAAESELATERARVRRASEIVSSWKCRVPYPLRESVRELAELLGSERPAEQAKDSAQSGQKEESNERRNPDDSGATTEQREARNPGLVGGAADSARDDRRSESRAEEPRTGTGHHQVGGSAALGRRSDDGGMTGDPAATDGGGASPGEAERVTHHVARELVGHRVLMAPEYPQAIVTLLSYVDQQEAAESERDRLRLDFANSCDVGRRLEAKLEAAEAELQRQSDEWAHLLEAADLLRIELGNTKHEWSVAERRWVCEDVTRDGCSCVCGGTCGCPCHDDEPGIDERRAALQSPKVLQERGD